MCSSCFQPLALGVVQAPGLSPERHPACVGRTLAFPQMECHARCPAKQHMGCSLVAARSQTALSEGVLILVLLTWTFLAGSGLAAHPGQSDSTAVPACGHHHAAHHGQGAATAGREAPSPAPAGPAPLLLRGRRYPDWGRVRFLSSLVFIIPSKFPQAGSQAVECGSPALLAYPVNLSGYTIFATT